ncbi:MAG: hypothetical protein C0401_12400 [Anaerolinea sp.]|nr:hypothetical protein [Anaerolinea sp.]
MTCLLGKSITKQRESLSAQLETIQEDIVRLSRFVSQLSGLTDEELAVFEITDQLQTIHRCLNRFEARCLAIQIAVYEDEFAAPVGEEAFETITPVNNNWTTVRREAKRANKLASQLTSSLSKIRSGLGEHQDQGPIPEDIVQLNQAVGNIVSGLAADWSPTWNDPLAPLLID